MDSITIHTIAVRKAMNAIRIHIPNPNSSCVCHKCENARNEK